MSIPKLKDLLSEKITLPIEIGDTILMGKFKNKKVVVKDISWNEKGDLLINGRPAMKMRILPKSNLKYEVNERVDFHDMATQIVKGAGLKSKIILIYVVIIMILMRVILHNVIGLDMIIIMGLPGQLPRRMQLF